MLLTVETNTYAGAVTNCKMDEIQNRKPRG